MRLIAVSAGKNLHIINPKNPKPQEVAFFMLPQEPYKKFAVITLYIAVAIAALYIIFNYLWGAILPFVIAYIFAECFRPVVRYSERNRRFPKRFFVLFVVLLAAISVAMLIYAATRQLFLEISDISSHIGDAIQRIQTDESYAEEMIEKINGIIPFVDIREKLWSMRENLGSELWSMAGSLSEAISGGIISFVSSAATFVPNVLLTGAVIIIATYYFAIDRVRVNCFFLSLFPKRIRPMLKTAKDVLAETVGRYLRAYGILFFITFGELLISFMLIGIDYSFVLALVIAIVDILPVLGAGTILIPWGIISLVSGDYARGVSLLVAYAIITVVRQIIEPKIVGKFIGLSPLAALAAMFVGLKLMGIVGIFILPIAAIVAKRILELRADAE